MLSKISTRNKIIAVIIVIAISAFFANKSSDEKDIIEEEKLLKEVQTLIISENDLHDNSIKTTGLVKAETQIDIIATTNGTLKNIYFEIGDDVRVNQLLASLFSASTLTGLNNARTFRANSQVNFESTKQLTNETIRQAELGVSNAKKIIESSEIALETTQNNLENAKNIQIKNIENTKTNAINSFHNNLNTIFATLNKVNYIINVDDDEPQINGITNVLSVKNLNALSTANLNYVKTKNTYNDLKNLNIDINNITENSSKIIEALNQTKILVENTIDALYETISSTNFPESTLSNQRNIFTSLKSSIINTETGAKNTLQALENLSLNYAKEIDSLEAAIKSAETQLDSAQLAYDNALINVDSAYAAQTSQLSASQQALDSANGQLNLSQTQTSNLYIKAPITGTITGKFVEIGAEINPGQKIAEISNTKKLKIEVNLSSADIYRIEKGSEVKILDNIIGIITSINPAADPVTKKVKVEILVDNKDKKLIQGTFVDIEIPTKELVKTNENSVFIPLKTVTITQSENYVFVVKDNKAIKKNIELGRTEGVLIEVLKGLNENDELILEGGKNLEDNENIEIRN